MANLKTFSGYPTQNRSSDTVTYAQALADNPYSGTWASGRRLTTACTYSGASGLGTQTDSLLFGGRKNSSFGPREQGSYAKELYTQVKTSYIFSGNP